MTTELRPAFDLLECARHPAADFEAEGGACVELSGRGGVQHRGEAVGQRHGVWLAVEVGRHGGSVAEVYVELDVGGAVRWLGVEDRGTAPRLFEGPSRRVWALLTARVDGRPQELALPARGRAELPEPALAQPFGGALIGAGDRIGQVAPDPGGPAKPDALQMLAIRDGFARREPKVRLPLPGGHDLLPEPDGFQALVRDGAGYLHRELSDRGSVVRERSLSLPQGIVRPARLSFDGLSELLVADERSIVHLAIGPNGATVRSMPLLELPRRRHVHGLSRVEVLPDGRLCCAYELTDGDGWFIARGGELQEHFTRVEHRGYAELMSGRDLLLRGAEWRVTRVALCARGYAAVVSGPSSVVALLRP
ncbi:MAG: hypothetical protein IPM29_08995 [Planctomycetes bacterium]|nr:hypothetical protein [Planctomycetota bacterium]